MYVDGSKGGVLLVVEISVVMILGTSFMYRELGGVAMSYLSSPIF